MRRVRLLMLIGILGLGAAVAVTAGLAQTPGLTRPLIQALRVGSAELSAGVAWTNLTGASFTDIGPGTAPVATDIFYSLHVRNTHATQSIRVQLQAGAGVAGALVPAGQTLTLDLYGLGVTTVSLLGSGAATTGNAIGYFGPN